MLIRRSLIALLITFSVPTAIAGFNTWVQRCSRADRYAEVEALIAKGDAEQKLLKGLWWSQEPKKLGDPVRFYYFHDGGVGLYRYGKLGLNHTNSFDYKIDGDTVRITFRKTGEEHAVRFSVEKDQSGDTWLTLHNDPREPQPTRYMKERVAPNPPPVVDEHPFARMWMNARKFKTGGFEFNIYQFKAPALDGRGVGWYHQGDFDDWSTEMLTYRKSEGQLELHFTLRDETAVTSLAEQHESGKRAIRLDEDPRAYGQRRTYTDGGASFALGEDVFSQLSIGFP